MLSARNVTLKHFFSDPLSMESKGNTIWHIQLNHKSFLIIQYKRALPILEVVKEGSDVKVPRIRRVRLGEQHGLAAEVVLGKVNNLDGLLLEHIPNNEASERAILCLRILNTGNTVSGESSVEIPANIAELLVVLRIDPFDTD